MMDLAPVCEALQLTYSSSATAFQRNKAIEYLQTLEKKAGFTVTLFKIATTNEIMEHLRQAAAIYLKRLAVQWDQETGPFFPEDKNIIRENLLEAITFSSPLIRVQLGDLLVLVLRFDFPNKMTNFVERCLQYVTSKEYQHVLGALYCLRYLFQRYEFLSLDEMNTRKYYESAIEKVLPILIQIFNFSLNVNVIESAEILTVISKIFWSITQHGLPDFFLQEEQFSQWIRSFVQLFEKPIAPEQIKVDQPLHRNQWWIAKKWAAHIFNKLIVRCGNPKSFKRQQQQQIAEIFMKNYSVKLLEVSMNFLAAVRQGVRSPEQIVSLILNYIVRAIYHAVTWLVMKPHVDVFFQEILFPLLCMYEYNEETFVNDPTEYMRSQYDSVTALFSIRTTILSWMIEIIKFRGVDYLLKFMHFLIHKVLNAYYSMLPQQRDARVKFGVLVMLSALAHPLKEHKQFADGLEEMLVLHVLPEMSHPNPLLRAKACVCFSRFANIKFKNDMNFVKGLEGLLNNVNVEHLSLRLEAATALGSVVKLQKARPLIRPLLPQLLDTLLKMLDEIDSEELLKTLNRLVEYFSDEMQLFTTKIAQKIVETFVRLVKETDPKASEDERENIAATEMRCIRTIELLLDATKNQPKIYTQLEPILIPMIECGLKEEEFIEDIVRIGIYLTYHGEKISENMWVMWKALYDILMSPSGGDRMPEMLSFFDNCISRGTERFFELNLVPQVCAMYEKLVKDPKCPVTDTAAACFLLEVLFLTCRTKGITVIDTIIPSVLEIAINRLQTVVQNDVKVVLLEVFINALYYNPTLTLNYVETKGWGSPLFDMWLDNVFDKFKRYHDKKLSVIALSTLFHLSTSDWPLWLRTKAPKILVTILNLIVQLRELRKEIERLQEEENDDDDSDDENLESDESDSLEDLDLDQGPLQSDGQVNTEYQEDANDNSVDENEDESGDDDDADETSEKNTAKKSQVDDAQDVPDDFDLLAEKIQQYYKDVDEENQFDLLDEDGVETAIDSIDEHLYFVDCMQGNISLFRVSRFLFFSFVVDAIILCCDFCTSLNIFRWLSVRPKR
jgi:hypothetical protein